MNYKTIINKEDTIYKIVRNIDLEGEEFRIPSNCVLDFQGGKIINGTIDLNQAKIIPNGCIITDYITATIKGGYATGQCLYDTTINKPKWYSGRKWVDATGADV